MKTVIANDRERQIRFYGEQRKRDQQRIREIDAAHSIAFKGGPSVIFMSDTGLLTNNSNDLWLFSEKTAIQAKDKDSTETYDFLCVPIFRRIERLQIQVSDAWVKWIGSEEQRGETPYNPDDNQSYTLSATIYLDGLSPLTFRATGVNCEKLQDVMDRFIVPNLIDRE